MAKIPLPKDARELIAHAARGKNPAKEILLKRIADLEEDIAAHKFAVVSIQKWVGDGVLLQLHRHLTEIAAKDPDSPTIDFNSLMYS